MRHVPSWDSISVASFAGLQVVSNLMGQFCPKARQQIRSNAQDWLQCSLARRMLLLKMLFEMSADRDADNEFKTLRYDQSGLSG